MSRFDSLHAAQEYAAERGYILTAEDYADIQQAQQQARERIASASVSGGKRTFVQRFNSGYPRLLRALHGLGEVLLTISQTMIVAFGVPLALTLMLFVEQQRVRGGIGLFEASATLTEFASSALVLVNLVIEFIVEYIETSAGYQSVAATRFSFRGMWQNARYTLGLKANWTPETLSPAQRFRTLRRIVTYAILSLALAGSMRDVITQQSGSWFEALTAVVTKSTLLQAATWTGGLMFAVAAVLTAQGLSRYVAVKCAEILSRMNTETTRETDLMSVEAEAAAAAVIVARVRADQQQTKLNAHNASVPMFLPVFENGENNENAENKRVPSPAVQTAMDWLTAHPERLNDPNREVAADAGMSPTVMYKAQRALRAQQANSVPEPVEVNA